ncbi:hypothetical protein Ae406Ps2_1962 [Pseudonocardia sp. Ae406_Ps2]|nr:hypothetical protein Ae406Ps2_1962 [Pseudonocardia sp. Ae406_Ps2]OLM06251.1 hypothetical protein Ae331Ps2_3961c [Pseudonocardia sp. Ae331_Ps2]
MVDHAAPGEPGRRGRRARRCRTAARRRGPGRGRRVHTDE